MYSNVQAELVSLKVFSNEQSGFVNNLNEENGRLVSEIQRLKSQAETRDRQLHESVAIAKKVRSFCAVFVDDLLMCRLRRHC